MDQLAVAVGAQVDAARTDERDTPLDPRGGELGVGGLLVDHGVQPIVGIVADRERLVVCRGCRRVAELGPDPGELAGVVAAGQWVVHDGTLDDGDIRLDLRDALAITHGRIFAAAGEEGEAHTDLGGHRSNPG